MESTIATNNPAIVSNPPSDVSMPALAEKLWRQVLLLSRGRVSVLNPTSGPMVNGANGNSSVEETCEEILTTQMQYSGYQEQGRYYSRGL